MNYIRTLTAGIALTLPILTLAQTYPSQPIKIIVPFSAGGVVDSVTRIIGEQMSIKLGQPVIVENRTGAGGAIGTQAVNNATPDGYTLLSVSPSHVVNPFIMKAATWNPRKDFRAVQGFGFVPNVIVVPASSPVKTMSELMALAKKSGAQPVTYATAGNGTSTHLSGLLLEQLGNIQLTQVPYRGQSEALNDLFGNRVMMMPLTAALAKPYVTNGKLRALAVTTATRATALPDVPTVADAAKLPGYEVSTWFGFVAPAKTPDAVIAKLATAVSEVLAIPEVKARISSLGMDLAPLGPKEFDQYIASESEIWGKSLKKAGIQAE
jgi:tripartite-type tricarboxylate transporter receptor subunit TctC